MEFGELLKVLKRELFYNPDTGIFTRLRTHRNVRAGDIAGCDNGGYLRIRVGSRKYYSHRVAWFYMTGAWPDGEIDHINGDKADNRWSNLRVVDRCTNMQNQWRAHKRNKSTGLLGAYVVNGQFIASITANGKQRYLGTFQSAQEAHMAYLQAKQKLHRGAICQI